MTLEGAERTLFHRLDGCRLGAHCAPVTAGSDGWPTTHNRPSRRRRLHVLPVADRMPVAPDSISGRLAAGRRIAYALRSLRHRNRYVPGQTNL